MSRETQSRKQAEKTKRFDAVLYNASVREDDREGDEHRRAAAHAHVMTHHALEMATPDAHRAAAAAHDKVSEMHNDTADELEDDEEPVSSEGPANRKNAPAKPGAAKKN